MGSIEKEQKEVLDIIKRSESEARRFLQKMISFDSQIIEQGVKGKEGNIQRWLAKELKTMGCQVDIFEPDNKKLKKYSDFNPGHDYTDQPNVVGILKGKEKGRSLILNGHVDTVSPGDITTWKHNPWSGIIEKGKIFGRGVCDMKAGVAAMIMAGLDKLEKEWLAFKHHPLLPSPTIMFGEIKGGIGASIIPDACELKVEIDYLPGEKKEDVQREVEDNILNISKADPWLKKHPPEINWLLNTSPYETRKDHSIVKIIKKVASKFIDNPEISGLPSGADARILNNIGGIPTVIFGSGNLRKAHSIDEYVSIGEYLKAIKVLALIMIGWSM